MLTVQQALNELTVQLQNIPLTKEQATQEAWWLLEKATGEKQAMLLLGLEQPLTQEQVGMLRAWSTERVDEHKPLQYILGTVPFGELEIIVEPPILIPRPETEEIVLWVIDQIRQSGTTDLKILDMCTGSGCIGLFVAHALPQAEVTGVDINPQAIALAEKNKQHNGIENINFIQSDLFENVEAANQYDVIISNPPYIAQETYDQLEDNVKKWEDFRALVADDDGMALYKKIMHEAVCYLRKPGHKTLYPQLVFEIGIDQVGMKQLLEQAGFTKVQLHKDMQGKQRWVSGWW